MVCRRIETGCVGRANWLLGICRESLIELTLWLGIQNSEVGLYARTQLRPVPVKRFIAYCCALLCTCTTMIPHVVVETDQTAGAEGRNHRARGGVLSISRVRQLIAPPFAARCGSCD